MAVRARGQLHDGVFDIAFYIARAVGNGQNTARRAAALDLYGDRIRIRFEHLAHHGNTGQQAAQGCGGNGAGFVQLLHSAHNGGGINAIEQDAAVFRNAAQQVAAVFIFCFTHRINDLPKQGYGG